ncbi:MAG TPA: SpoIID/LytB domain-containing protein [Gemmatimonadaceae bacterium]|nr:SpoIID/LytB domain-containing protein [Gemmatimonadaceae bacterium]
MAESARTIPIGVAVAALLLGSCAAPRTSGRAPAADDAGTAPIRVMLAVNAATAEVSANGAWFMLDPQRRLMARVGSGDRWLIERSGDRIRGVNGAVRTGWVDGPIYAAMTSDGFLTYSGRRYRGEIVFRATPGGILVVNRVRIDDYLSGVVPLEIGNRPAAESAAVQAQAITARSYAYTHLDPSDPRGYDVTATVADQVYGGVNVETATANRAIAATRGLVLKYAGRVVNAPYSSTCGGQTAEASEVWRSTDEPYLKRVSDRIPGTDRFYCDPSPRFTWTKSFEQADLAATIARYLSTVTTVPGGDPGRPRSIAVASRTPSGRIGALTIVTDRGSFTVRGNDIRSVLRGPGGEILYSTYFSVDSSQERDGYLTKLTLRGGGHGHGVGMCQWGAIGRARAGQDFRTILATYYPGTTVGPVR